MHCAVPFFCARSGTEGEAACRCGEWVVRSAGNASHSLRACVGAAWGSGSAREGRVAVRGRAEVFGGECIAQLVGVHRDCVGERRRCVGERKCSGRACRCVGAGVDLRRGMHRAACGRASGLRGGTEVLGEGVSLCGGERRSSAGNGLCGRWGMHRAACGRASALRGRAEVLGQGLRCAGASGDLQRGMGGEGGGFNAHSPQQHARTCIIIYTSALSAP